MRLGSAYPQTTLLHIEKGLAMIDNEKPTRKRHRTSGTLLLSFLIALGAVACSSDAGEEPAPNDDPQLDAGTDADGEKDAGEDPDAGDDADTGDSGDPDAGDDADTEDPVVARVEVTPTESEVKERRPVQLSAKAFGEDDAELEDATITWASSDEDLATVDENGLVSTLRPGEVTITASSGGESAEATITITESTVASLEVEGDGIDVPLDGSITIPVTVKDEEGYELLGRELSFTSDDESIATVDEDGKVSGVDLGETKITVGIGDLEDSIDVRVVHRFAQIFAGHFHTCGLTERGRAFCWGRNQMGQVGVGKIEPWETESEPVRVLIDESISFQTLALGEKHSCGLTTDEKVWCWGSNEYGQLGEDPDEFVYSTIPVELEGLSFKALTSMADSLCGLDEKGHAHCWGYNSGDTEFGNPDVTTASPTPVAVAPPEGETDPLAFTELGHGFYHSCGLTADGRLFCWGHGSHGQIGNGESKSVARPVQVLTAQKVTKFALMGRSTCAMRDDDKTYCWGHNGYYQVAVDPETTWDLPVLSLRPDEGDIVPVSFGFGEMHACALDDDGKAHCWGANTSGQLGRYIEGDNKGWIDEIEADKRFTSIVAGSLHTCGLADDGKTYCWGSNMYGQFGNGLTNQGGRELEAVKGQ